MSLAEETEAGSSEYRERLLELVESRRGGRRPRRAFAAAYVRRLARPSGISAEHLAAEVLGAFRFAAERGRAPVAVRAFNPTLEQRRLRAARLGAGDQHRRLAVPGRLGERGAGGARRARRPARAPDHRASRARTGKITARHARAQRDPPRVGHALRPRAPADRRASSPSSTDDVRGVLLAVRNTVTDFGAMTQRVESMIGARAPRQRALRLRRGARGGRLPRLAAARQLRAARRARVRDQGRRLPLHPRLRPRHPGRRGALRLLDAGPALDAAARRCASSPPRASC